MKVPLYICIIKRKNDMDFWTFFNDIMNNEGTYHSLLLLLLLADDETEKFLNADNFKEGVENDGRKKFIINELERAKYDLREIALTKQPIYGRDGKLLTPMEIHQQVESHKLRIQKLRLMINYELMTAHNTHKPTSVVYVAARGLWINNAGVKFKKFSKNIGTSDTVYDKNGKIHESLKRESENEIIQMMWETYKMEYSETNQKEETS
jgi:hypothetical protein